MLNKVMLIGNLGQEPDVRYMPDGQAVANLTVATSEKWKDKRTGEQKERTEWHRVVLFRRLAEIAAQYLTKGAKVYIEGKLQTRKWQDQSGQDRYTAEIVADKLQMLGGAVKSKQEMPPATTGTTAAKPQGFEEDFIEDDIPF